MRMTTIKIVDIKSLHSERTLGESSLVLSVERTSARDYSPLESGPSIRVPYPDAPDLFASPDTP